MKTEPSQTVEQEASAPPQPSEPRERAIKALLAKWFTRESGLHAGYLTAPQIVDLVLAAAQTSQPKLPPLPVKFTPDGGCTCAGPDGPCEACTANEEAYREWLTEPCISPREAMDYARAYGEACAAAPPQPVPAEPPAGWKLVPLEPTPDMLLAAELSNPRGYTDLYRAMLSATPLVQPAPPPALKQVAWGLLNESDRLESWDQLEYEADLRAELAEYAAGYRVVPLYVAEGDLAGAQGDVSGAPAS
jgi:hypothetical protein